MTDDRVELLLANKKAKKAVAKAKACALNDVYSKFKKPEGCKIYK